MPLPTPITNHVERAKARLTSMFRSRAVIEGLLGVFVKQVQRLENETWNVINGRSIDDSVGVQLDVLGRFVQEPRNGRSDDDYREAIRLRILVLRSTGRAPDVLRIVATAAKGAYWEYRETYPAGFDVLFTGTVPAFLALANALAQAKGNGIGRAALYATPAAEVFRPSSTAGDAPLARGPSHHADGLPRSVFVHVAPLP